MSKELTPMQELIEWNNSRDKFSQLTWIELDAKLKELLPKEKQVIEDAVNDTQKFLIGKDDVNLGEIYYNTKYKNYEI